MNDIIQYIVNNDLGDVASVVGIVITIIGFGVTLWQVYRSKSASLQAKESVEHFQKEVLKYKTVSDLSETISMVNEIKELNRQSEWKLLLHRYSDLKRRFIDIKQSNIEFTKFQNQNIQDMIFAIDDICDIVENIVNKNVQEDEFDITKINRIITKHADGIFGILIKIKSVRGIDDELS